MHGPTRSLTRLALLCGLGCVGPKEDASPHDSADTDTDADSDTDTDTDTDSDTDADSDTDIVWGLGPLYQGFEAELTEARVESEDYPGYAPEVEMRNDEGTIYLRMRFEDVAEPTEAGGFTYTIDFSNLRTGYLVHDLRADCAWGCFRANKCPDGAPPGAYFASSGELSVVADATRAQVTLTNVVFESPDGEPSLEVSEFTIEASLATCNNDTTAYP